MEAAPPTAKLKKKGLSGLLIRTVTYLFSWIREIPKPKDMPLDVRRRILRNCRISLVITVVLVIHSWFFGLKAYAYHPIIIDYEINYKYDVNPFGEVFGMPVNAQPAEIESLTRAGRRASAEISESLDRVWNQSLVGFYPAIQVSSATIALLSSLVMGIRLGARQKQEGLAAWDEVTVPILLASLLYSPLAVQIPLAVREISNSTNAALLTLTDFNTVFQEANASSSFEATIAPAFQQCKTIDADQQEKCLTKAVEAAQEVAAQQEATYGDAPWIARWKQRLSELQDTLLNAPLSGAGVAQRVNAVNYAVLSPVYESVVYGLLTAGMAAYQIFLEIAMLLTSLIIPYSIAASIGLQAQPLIAAVLAMFSFGQAKALFNVSAGFASSILIGVSGGVDNLWLPIGLAIFGIPISFLLAAGGGLAVWKGFIGAGGSLTTIALRLRHRKK